VGQGIIIVEASRSHSHASQSVELLWTSHQPDADTYRTTQNTHTTQTSTSPGFGPANQPESGRRHTP